MRLIASVIGAGLSLLLAAGPALAHDTYEVRRGDTLSQIAAAHGTSWPELFRLNRSIIDDPDLIFPGQVLALEPDDHKAKAEPAADSETSSTDAGTDVRRPATGHVTSSYGMRTHPITGEYKLHSGTDYSVGDGNAYAVRAGVVSVSHPAWAGNLVTIAHRGGMQTRYGHLATVTVRDGERVSAGAVVGRIGSRGWSTGPHLHFECLRGGEFVNPASCL